MAYELLRTGEEMWLVLMPDLVVDDIRDDLPWIDIFNDIQYLLKLPNAENYDQIVLKLTTSLLYEAKRHGWDERPCLHRRQAIGLLSPDKKNWTERQYESFLSGQGDYFGQDLSDNSDNDDNINLETGNNTQQVQLILQAQSTKGFWKNTRRSWLQKRLKILLEEIEKPQDALSKQKKITDSVTDIKEKLKPKELQERIPVRTHSTVMSDENNNREKYRDAINAIIKKSQERENREFTKEEILRIRELSRMGKFYVAQYRGINYMIDRWNAPSRRYHRRMHEVGKPQYSPMVLGSLGFSFCTQLTEETDYVRSKDLKEILESKANNLRGFFLRLREKTFCVADALGKKKYLFNNILDYFQHHYSNGVKDFLKTLELLRKNYEFWRKNIPNANNPFYSTSNTAYHALKYAYGMKDYYDDDILMPRYRHDGQIEYSHVGKFYLSLHTLDNILLDQCLHNVPQMEAEGRVLFPPPQTGNIGAEKEFTFICCMAAKQVIFQYVPKFTDFSSKYLRIYEVKYGLNTELFTKFQYLIRNSRPNSPIRQLVVDLLSEWLCSYHSVLLIHLAAMEAEKREGTLIYVGYDGLLTSERPKLVSSNDQSEPERQRRWELNVNKNIRRLLGGALYKPDPKKEEIPGFFLSSKTQVQKALGSRRSLAALAADKIIDKLPNGSKDLKKRAIARKEVCAYRRSMILRLQPLKFSNHQSRLSTCQLQLIVEAKGFELQDVPGDGNCFFHAVKAQLEKMSVTAYDYKDLRAIAISYILDNLDEFSEFLCAANPYEGDIHKFIDKNIRDGVWADDHMINALMRGLAIRGIRVNLVIFRSDGAAPTHVPIENATGMIHLGYEVGFHYWSVVPMGISSSSIPSTNPVNQELSQAHEVRHKIRLKIAPKKSEADQIQEGEWTNVGSKRWKNRQGS